MNQATDKRTRDLNPGVLATDPHLYIIMVSTFLTGLGLHWLLPTGYAQGLVAPWQLFGVLVLAPLLEEWLFRGVIQGELRRHRWARQHHLGISIANVLTSVAFVLAHTVYHGGLWAMAVFIPSLVLGHFRERYDGLSLPIALHALFNLTYLVAGIAE